MLDQLVESKSNSAENKRRGNFILVTLVIAVTIMVSSWTYSLFAKDFGMGGDDLALTTLVAPVPVPDEAPPPEPEKQPQQQQKQPDVDVRKELIQNIMQTPVKPPEQISATKNAVKEMRLDRMTKLGSADSDTGAKINPGQARVVESGGTGGLSTGTGTATRGGNDDAPPPPPPPPATPKPAPKTVSGGVLTGKCTSCGKPAYPATAKQVGASGAVTVQVLIDEEGRVVSANAVSGHPLLKAAAVAAARSSRFSPTMLSGQPVKVSGVITYNFVQ
jgi:periplasmic protein TonB